MSLVVALTKSKEAVIGGDRRSITFLGSWPELEEELYCGRISDDEALLAKAMRWGHSAGKQTAGTRSGGGATFWWER